MVAGLVLGALVDVGTGARVVRAPPARAAPARATHRQVGAVVGAAAVTRCALVHVWNTHEYRRRSPRPDPRGGLVLTAVALVRVVAAVVAAIA